MVVDYKNVAVKIFEGDSGALARPGREGEGAAKKQS
jgi:hypothetical protein